MLTIIALLLTTAPLIAWLIRILVRHTVEERMLASIPVPPVPNPILGHTQLAFFPGNQHRQLRVWSDHVRSGIFRLRFLLKKVVMTMWGQASMRYPANRWSS